MKRSVDVLTRFADSPAGHKGEREISWTLAAQRIPDIQTMSHSLAARGRAVRQIMWRQGFPPNRQRN
jgi:hypothetical protein